MQPGRVLRSRRGFAALVAVGAVTLTACFAPAPAPTRQSPTTSSAPTTSSTAPTTTTSTTTTTTTAGPTPAHLTVSPNPLSFTADRTISPFEDPQTITVTNDGGLPSGSLDAFSSVLTDPGPGNLETWFFSDLNHCLGSPLAAGTSCTFTLVFQAQAYVNSSWTGDLIVQATPGGAAHVPVTAHVTTRLSFDQITDLTATSTTDGSTHFVLSNVGPDDFGPMSFTQATLSMAPVGNFVVSSDGAFGVPTCSQGMTLAAGTSCQWLVSYHNTTGAGTNGLALIFDVPGLVHAQADFNGTGTP